jgi:hypothetical protein
MPFVKKLIWGAVGKFAWRKGREYWRQRQASQRSEAAPGPAGY